MRKKTILTLCAMIAIISTSASFALYSVGKGGWPQNWPKELEPFRDRSRTLHHTNWSFNIHEIPFSNREEFEAAWPHILSVKSKNAPITLLRSPDKKHGETLKAGVRIYAPLTGTLVTPKGAHYPARAESAIPDGKFLRIGPPWPDHIKSESGTLPEYVIYKDGKFSTYNKSLKNDRPLFQVARARIEIELIVDGDVVDLSRISLPENTPIIDEQLTKKVVDVYVLSGQSNMQGIGKLSNLPESSKKSPRDVFFWNGKSFEPLEIGKTKTSARPGEFGPEIAFAQVLRMRGTACPIYLIKHHASGQPLHHGWNRNTWEGGDPAPGRWNFYPGETLDDPNIGGHYRRLTTTSRAALANLKENGVPYRIRGVAWMQGEQDSKNHESAVEYAKNLGRFKRRLEEDLGSGPLPLVYGQALPHEPALERFICRYGLRQSQKNAHSLSGHKDAVAGAWMVSTDEMPLLPDTVHYNARGQAMLGEAFARTMLRAISSGS